MSKNYKIDFWIILLSILLGASINRIIENISNILNKPFWLKISLDITVTVLILLLLLYFVTRKSN